MKIFFDCEMTGLHRNSKLISIGLISENNHSFYAEFNDYKISDCSDWIIKNVISNLCLINNKFSAIADKNIIGDKYLIRHELLLWLDNFNSVEWVSDVCHYDMMLLIDLLYGDALKIPHNISAVCHDINQDIARYYNISEMSAFDKSREKIIDELKIINTKGLRQHNSLYDAKVIKAIYEKLANKVEAFCFYFS